MPIDLYYIPGSGPCRSVILAAKALGVDLNLKFTNLFVGEQLKPEYIKMNPQHTVPTMDDGGFYLWESRAILSYLVNQYGKDDSLYPSDPKARAVVDQRLYFDVDVLYRRFGDAYYPYVFGDAANVADDKLVKFNEALQWLDDYLAKGKWVTGDQLTIADFSIVASLTTADVCGHDITPYANVTRWLADCAATMAGYAESYEDGRELFQGAIEKKKNK